MNPVWKRELRARWRGWRAFGLVFFVVVVLAGGFTWQYHENTRVFDDLYYEEYSDPRQRLSLLGHELFVLLAWLQMVLWMLLAPILTATAITSEREKGLLESLQLSRLRAGQIVTGKLLSAFSLIALLIVVTLPITATCFLMGGVSPEEFLLVLALHAATSLCCAAMGLAISAWCRNGITAIALGIVAVCLWSALAIVSAFAALGGFAPRFGAPGWPWRQLLELFVKAHPITAVVEASGMFSRSGTTPWTTSTPSWVVSLIFLLASTAGYLFIASLGTRRILSTAFRFEWQMLRKQLRAEDATNLESTTIAPPKTKVRGKHWELGALARMQFANPVLGREVRACFRPRSTSIVMLALAGGLTPLAALAYASGFYWVIVDPMMRGIIAPALLGAYLVLTILLCAVLGASGFSREHEGGTWEALRLSLLSPRQVLWGKMGAPLLICAACGLAFVPMVLPCVRTVVYYNSHQINGISLTQFLATLSIIASSAWCFTLIGLCISNFFKRSVTAICATLGVLLATLVGVTGYASSLGSSGAEDFLQTWHPFFAMLNIFERQTRYDEYGENPIATSTFGAALPCVLLLISIGGLCFLVLRREIYRPGKSGVR